jgi:hypothetical protein
MKDREYYQQLISNRMDQRLTPAEEEDLAIALGRDPSLAEYEQKMLWQQSALRELPTVTAPPLASSFAIPEQKPSLLRRAWKIQLRIPLPLAASLALCLTGWVWLSGNDNTEPSKPAASSSVVKYVQVERLEPAMAIPTAYHVNSSNTTIKEGEL